MRRLYILTKLPVVVREELEKRLTEKSFSDYTGLARWLKGLGYKISRNAVFHYGTYLQRRLEAVSCATAQIRLLAESSAGDAEVMTDAVIRLVQERIFTMLVEGSAPLSPPGLLRFTKMINELGRMTSAQRRWQGAVQLAKQQRIAQEKLSELESAGAFSKQTAEQIRDLLLGINPFAGTPAQPQTRELSIALARCAARAVRRF